MTRRAASRLNSPTLVRVAPPRLAAPPTLPAAEAAVWTATVRALPPGWFSADMIPLLRQYCRHVVRADALQALADQADPVADLRAYAKLLGLIAQETGRILSCARAMRLTPQARVLASTAGSKAGAARPERTAADDAMAVLELVAATKEGKR